VSGQRIQLQKEHKCVSSLAEKDELVRDSSFLQDF
jgi:hypothetical protein